LVAPRAGGRNVVREQRRDHGHALRDRRAGLAGRQPRAHRLARRLPLVRRDPAQAAVGHDLDGVVGQPQVDQDTVVGFRVPDPQLREYLLGPLARGHAAPGRHRRKRGFHREHHLAAMQALTGGDRLANARHHRAGETAAGRRGQQVPQHAPGPGHHHRPDAPPPPDRPPPPDQPPPPDPPLLQPPPPRPPKPPPLQPRPGADPTYCPMRTLDSPSSSPTSAPSTAPYGEPATTHPASPLAAA